MFGLVVGGENDPKDGGAAQRATGYKNALLSVLTIGGGTSGVLSCLIWLVNRHSSAREVVAVSLVAAVYMLGIWAGIACQRQSARGQKWMKVFLFAQVPVLQSPLVSFKCTALCSYTVIFYWKILTLNAGWYLGDDWELSWLRAMPDLATGVNLLPLGMMSLIWGPSMMWRAARKSG
jgi:hypothetical protein